MRERKISGGVQIEYLQMMQKRYREADHVAKSRLLDEWRK